MFALFAACANPYPTPPEVVSVDHRLRTSVAAACDLVSTCGFAGLDPARCLSDETLFDVTVLEGEVVAVTLSSPGGTGLTAGTWFTVYDSPSGLCEDAVVYTFEVSGGSRSSPPRRLRPPAT